MYPSAKGSKSTHRRPGTLVEQLVEPWAGRIESGSLGAGSRLPTEAELMRVHGVSRTTVRRALDELHERGLVSRESGRGTFVASPRIPVGLPCLYRLAAAIEGHGLRPGARVLGRERRPAGEAVAARLGIAPRDPVLCLRAVCTAGDRPLLVVESHLNLARYPVLAAADLAPLDLIEAAAGCAGDPIAGTRSAITAAGAAIEVARDLGIRRTAPLLELERSVDTESGSVLETARVHLHPGRCLCRADPAGPPGDTTG